MPPSPASAEGEVPGVEITTPGVPALPPTGLSDRELIEWYREQVALRDEDLGRFKALVAEREAEVARLTRDEVREEGARRRAEGAEAQVMALLRELASLREASLQSLQKAEHELASASQRLTLAHEAVRTSRPPPPNDLDEERVRSAHLVARLAEAERSRDLALRERDEAHHDRAAALAEVEPLNAALVAREARVQLAEAAVQAAEARAVLAHQDSTSARVEADQLARGEDEARAAMVQATRAEADARAQLDAALRQSSGAKEEQVRLRETVEGLRPELVAKAEELSSARNELAAARSMLLAAQKAADEKTAQLATVQKALDAAREREAALDAELRVGRGQQAEVHDQLADEIEAARRETRAARGEAQQTLDQLNRSEARAAELQSVIDSLGRERAALRSEAGQMRARVEVLAAAEERWKQELEDLRGENDFLNQEIARIATATRPPQSAPPPLPSKLAE